MKPLLRGSCGIAKTQSDNSVFEISAGRFVVVLALPSHPGLLRCKIKVLLPVARVAYNSQRLLFIGEPWLMTRVWEKKMNNKKKKK